MIIRSTTTGGAAPEPSMFPSGQSGFRGASFTEQSGTKGRARKRKRRFDAANLLCKTWKWWDLKDEFNGSWAADKCNRMVLHHWTIEGFIKYRTSSHRQAKYLFNILAHIHISLLRCLYISPVTPCSVYVINFYLSEMPGLFLNTHKGKVICLSAGTLSTPSQRWNNMSESSQTLKIAVYCDLGGIPRVLCCKHILCSHSNLLLFPSFPLLTI